MTCEEAWLVAKRFIPDQGNRPQKSIYPLQCEKIDALAARDMDTRSERR